MESIVAQACQPDKPKSKRLAINVKEMLLLSLGMKHLIPNVGLYIKLKVNDPTFFLEYA